MFPLPAGGHPGSVQLADRTGARLTGAIAFRKLYLAQAVLVLMLIAVAASAASAGQAVYGADGITVSEDVPDTGTGATSVISFVAPTIRPTGASDRRDRTRYDWTLRDARPLRVSASGEAPSRSDVTPYAASRAEVAMFSWKEIAVVALIVAFALGALLAFTGGGEQRHTRHF